MKRVCMPEVVWWEGLNAEREKLQEGTAGTFCRFFFSFSRIVQI